MVKLYYPNSVLKYEGDVKDDKFDGKGKLYRKDGTLLYEGDFKDNEFSGKGKEYREDGTALFYEGDFQINEDGEGEKNGKGKMYYLDSITLLYEGDFKGSSFCGKGKMYYKNGTLKYEGDFKDDELNGKGKEYREDGTLKYEGDFEDGKITDKDKVYRKDDGIKIKDTIITFLSGPISFYYLKPNLSNIDPSEIKYFPLIILFGDKHRSKQGSCVNCSCSKEEGKCCYTISDHSFLQLLDTLGSKLHPIDFYTETFLGGTSTGFLNGYMEDLTTKDMVTCYHKTLRGTEYNKCPTKNIRWQAGDARQAGNDVVKSGRNYNYIRHDETVRKLFDKNINGKRFIDTVSKKFRDDVYIEFQFTGLIDELYNIFNYLYKKDYNFATYGIDRFNKLLLKSEFKTLDKFLTLLNTLYDEETKLLNTDKFSETFFAMMTRENSLIFKQIMKQEYLPFKDINYWSKMYAESLRHMLIDSHDFLIAPEDLKKLLLNVESVVTDIDGYDEFDLSPDIRDWTNVLDMLHVAIGSPLLDIYTITRIFKKPDGGNRSSLSFGYFGDAHVKNIVDFLLATNKYTLVNSTLNDGLTNRCLEFDFPLNLEEELRIHNELIGAVAEDAVDAGAVAEDAVAEDEAKAVADPNMKKLYREDGTLQYEGHFENGDFNGKGKQYYLDGITLAYEGDFKDDTFNGKGKRYKEDGNLEYEGDFKDGKYHGKGKLYYPDGIALFYEGDFKDNKYHGKGKRYYPYGTLAYEGDFKDGKFDGKGKLYRKDGTLAYEGDFKDNKYHGKGKEYKEDGTIGFKGSFIKGYRADKDLDFDEGIIAAPVPSAIGGKKNKKYHTKKRKIMKKKNTKKRKIMKKKNTKKRNKNYIGGGLYS